MSAARLQPSIGGCSSLPPMSVAESFAKTARPVFSTSVGTDQQEGDLYVAMFDIAQGAEEMVDRIASGEIPPDEGRRRLLELVLERLGVTNIE